MTKISDRQEVSALEPGDQIPIVRPSGANWLDRRVAGSGAVGGYVDALLTVDAGATETAVTVNRVPAGVIANGFWVVIDPWTTECEIRKVTAISDTVLTMAALTYAHSDGDGVMFIVDPVISVKWFGAVGDNSIDDTTAIQRAIDASGIGWTIQFAQGDTYSVTGDIRLLPYRKYSGGGLGPAPNGRINLADSSDPDGILISDGWYNNTSSAELWFDIRDLYIFGNYDNNVSGDGILLVSARAVIENVVLEHIPGHAIHLTDTTRDSSQITTWAGENRIAHVLIDGTEGHGIFIENQDATARTTDGFLVDNLISGVQDNGIEIEHAGGWTVRGNHLYIGSSTTMQHFINVAKPNFALIEGNFLENGYGLAAATGVCAGIQCTDLQSNQAVTIANNRIWNTKTEAGNTYYGINLVAGTGQAAEFIVTGNYLNLNSTETALRFVLASGGSITGTVVGNFLRDFGTWSDQDSSANITYVGNIPRVMFSVHRDGTDQTGIVKLTWTKVVWTTEIYDTNSDFNLTNDRFYAPVDGVYRFEWATRWVAFEDQSEMRAAIYREGSENKTVMTRASGTSNVGVSGSVEINMDEGDYAEVFVYQTTSGDQSLEGAATETWWTGSLVG